MRCFEVWVNGQRLYTAGLPFPARLHGHFHGRQPVPDSPPPAGAVGGHFFTFSGTDTNGDNVSWPLRELQVGDEVVIRVVEADASDEPTSRHARDDAKFVEMERKMYEKMKRKFEPTGPTDTPPTTTDEPEGA